MKQRWSHGTAGRHKINVAQQQELIETNRVTFKVKLMKRQGENVAGDMILFSFRQLLIKELYLFFN